MAEPGQAPGQSPGRPERRATMRDVARRTGVSIMTVSRVVNGGASVDPATRERVESQITALGYRPNAAASSLRRMGAASLSVGLVVDDVANPFSSAVTSGVERVCRARGHLLLTGSSGGEASQERTLISAFLTRRVDGLIVMGSDPDHGYLAQEARRGVGLVFVDRSPGALAADLVATDNVEAARIATAHLIQHGHRRIALLAGRLAFDTTLRRHDGYRLALDQAGLDPDPALERLDVADSDAAAQLFGELLDGPDPPTAVFAAQNLVSIGVLHALYARGLQRQVAMVGMDDLALATLLDPPVTVLAQAPVQIGTQAAALLFERLAGRDGPPREIAVPSRLVRRGSGEIRPGGGTPT